MTTIGGTIMTSISRPVFVCAVFISFLVFTTWCDLAYGAKDKLPPVGYTLTLVDADVQEVLSINNKGSILAERQTLPLVIGKNGRETAPFECPGANFSTTGEALNNLGEVAGHCVPGFALVGFLANPKTGSFLFSFPGADATVAFGVNDFGQVVGYYQVQAEFHGLLWDRSSGTYYDYRQPTGQWWANLSNKNQQQRPDSWILRGWEPVV
jgi:hypothetical protein